VLCNQQPSHHLLPAREPARISVDTTLDTLGGITKGRLSSLNLSVCSVLRSRASDVRAVEEAHEEIHQWTKVEDVQPDGKGLAGGVDTVDRLVLHACHSSADLLSKTLGTGSTVDGLLDGAWASSEDGGREGDVVGDEGMCASVVDANDELHDLHGCEGLLDRFRDADGESGDGVVGVLIVVSSDRSSE
jgi:hypothetical protein